MEIIIQIFILFLFFATIVYFMKGKEKESSTNPFIMAFRWMVFIIGSIFKGILLLFGVKTGANNAYGSAKLMSFFTRSKILSSSNEGLLIETNKRIINPTSLKRYREIN